MVLTRFQLKHRVEAVMEEVRLVWTRSRSYCKPGRIVVLLQKICNLFIHLVLYCPGPGTVLVWSWSPVLTLSCL